MIHHLSPEDRQKLAESRKLEDHPTIVQRLKELDAKLDEILRLLDSH